LVGNSVEYSPVAVGGVVSIINLAHVLFPPKSVTTSVYVHSAEILSPLDIGAPLSVAVSLNVIVTLQE